MSDESITPKKVRPRDARKVVVKIGETYVLSRKDMADAFTEQTLRVCDMRFFQKPEEVSMPNDNGKKKP